MGLSTALFEDGVVDARSGHVVTQNLADYHIAANADIGAIDAFWLDETDLHANPMGSRGIGEIGIVRRPPQLSPTPPITPPASACVTSRSRRIGFSWPDVCRPGAA